MKHRVRRPVGPVCRVVGWDIGKPIIGVEARELDHPFTTALAQQVLGETQEVVVGREVLEDGWVNEHRRIQLRDGGPTQAGELTVEVAQQRRGFTRSAEREPNTPLREDTRRKRAERPPNDDGLHPFARGV